LCDITSGVKYVETAVSPDCHHRQSCPRIVVSLLASGRFRLQDFHRALIAVLLNPHWKPATGVLFFLWYPSFPVWMELSGRTLLLESPVAPTGVLLRAIVDCRKPSAESRDLASKDI
jgi:hypothetical protein